jgi:cardiolipin synthase (CMP-forming)
VTVWTASSVPNALSAARIALGAAFPFAPAEWRVWLVVAAALSDAFDGLLARVLRAESDAGRLLDPVADKVFALALFGTLLLEGTLHPLWALGLLLRDVFVLIGMAWVLLHRDWARGRRMYPSLVGKLTTGAHFAVFLALVVWGEVPLWALLCATAVSAAAALDYARQFFGPQREPSP